MRSCILTGAILSIAATACWAADATLVGDAYITSANPAGNYGALPSLNVGAGATSLVGFSLAGLPSSIASTSIVKANLILYVNRVVVQGSVAVAPIQGTWSETTVTYGTNPGMGAAVASAVSVTQSGEYVVADVTSTVQGWITTPASNFGLAVYADPSASSTNITLDSKESTTTSHPARLEITLASTDPNLLSAVCSLFTAVSQTPPANIDCASTCVSPQTYCSGTCVNTQNNVNHCGSCSNACFLQNATPVCTASACAIGTCNPGFGDCDHIAANGCETNIMTNVNNCGTCGKSCAPVLNGSPTCSGAVCAIGGCNSGFANCSGVYANGCNDNILADSNNCGFCGHSCGPGIANGFPVCAGGACGYSCNAGATLCGGNQCVFLQSDNNNCGACGNVCGLFHSCVAGACS
jgi:hypothetical protein